MIDFSYIFHIPNYKKVNKISIRDQSSSSPSSSFSSTSSTPSPSSSSSSSSGMPSLSSSSSSSSLMPSPSESSKSISSALVTYHDQGEEQKAQQHSQSLHHLAAYIVTCL